MNRQHGDGPNYKSNNDLNHFQIRNTIQKNDKVPKYLEDAHIYSNVLADNLEDSMENFLDEVSENDEVHDNYMESKIISSTVSSGSTSSYTPAISLTCSSILFVASKCSSTCSTADGSRLTSHKDIGLHVMIAEISDPVDVPLNDEFSNVLEMEHNGDTA